MIKKTQILYSITFIFMLTASVLFAQDTQILEGRLITKRTSVYLHETVEIILEIRSAGINLGENMQLQNMPPLSQLEQIGSFQEHAPVKEESNGSVLTVKRFTGKYRPLTTGDILLQPRIGVDVISRGRSFFGTSIMNHSPYTMQIRPLRLSVTNIPVAGQPAGFENAIGVFSFNAKVEPSDVAVGDLVNISTTVRGDGYMKEISPIGISSNPCFKTYAPALVRETPDMKFFLQTVVVINTNATAIPALSFSYFNPELAEYRTVTLGPFPLLFHDKKTVAIEQFRPDKEPDKQETDLSINTDSVPLNQKTISLKYRNRSLATAIMQNDEPLRFAPSHSALITVEIPLNAHVTVIERHQDWCKVEYKNNRGWLPQSALSISAE